MPGPGTHRLALQHDGLRRSFLVHVPASYAETEKLPVVLMLHGAGATALWTVQETGWIATADRVGFLAVFPEGVPVHPHEPPSFRRNPQLWNDGSGRGAIGRMNVDDVGFFRSLLDFLEAKFAVDPQRIYAAGFSNGGGLTYRLGVELADRLAAIAPVAAHCWVETPRPRRPVPTFALVGVNDPLAPLAGGEVQSPFGGRTWMPPLADTWNKWASALGCPPEAELLHEHDGVRTVRHGPCDRGAELRICTVAGLGHHWPGGKGLLNPRLAGPPSDKVWANDLLWEFFRGHRR